MCCDPAGTRSGMGSPTVQAYRVDMKPAVITEDADDSRDRSSAGLF